MKNVQHKIHGICLWVAAWFRRKSFLVEAASCDQRVIIGYLPDGRKILYFEDKCGKLIGHPCYSNTKEDALTWLNLTMGL